MVRHQLYHSDSKLLCFPRAQGSWNIHFPGKKSAWPQSFKNAKIINGTRIRYMISFPAIPTACLELKSENFRTVTSSMTSSSQNNYVYIIICYVGYGSAAKVKLSFNSTTIEYGRRMRFRETLGTESELEFQLTYIIAIGMPNISFFYILILQRLTELRPFGPWPSTCHLEKSYFFLSHVLSRIWYDICII